MRPHRQAPCCLDLQPPRPTPLTVPRRAAPQASRRGCSLPSCLLPLLQVPCRFPNSLQRRGSSYSTCTRCRSSFFSSSRCIMRRRGICSRWHRCTNINQADLHCNRAKAPMLSSLWLLTPAWQIRRPESRQELSVLGNRRVEKVTGLRTVPETPRLSLLLPLFLIMLCKALRPRSRGLM